jgi:anti-sigma regulatory factor (Ser/Thr protein kinase)
VELAREFPAVAASLRPIRHAVAESAAQAGGSPDTVAGAVWAANEAATNAIVHAYDGGSEEAVITLTVGAEDGWLDVVVRDAGSGFNPRRHSPGVGLGLALIAQFADEFQLREGEGTEVRMRFRLDG